MTARPPERLSAQAVFEQFSYDNLRLSGVQLDLGMLGSDELRGALVGGLRLDYGQIAPRVRVLLGLSYFSADFDGKARARFEQRIRAFVIDPTGDDTIRVGRIRWSDLTADLDLQYVLPQGSGLTTYLGLGFGVHLRDGGGGAIEGTFIEDALDGISAALNTTIGVELTFTPSWRFTLDGRGVISSDLSTISLRGGVMYRFGGGGGGKTR
ncbi:MAG: hypothetical protein ACREL9_13900 [Gemmatimonadales bacterium]